MDYIKKIQQAYYEYTMSKALYGKPKKSFGEWRESRKLTKGNTGSA